MDEVALDSSHGVLSMLFSSGPVVMAVLWLLIILSVFSWGIVIAKYLQLKRAGSESSEFKRIFWDSRNFAKIDDSLSPPKRLPARTGLYDGLSRAKRKSN